jgi:hypothetical protein
MARGLDGVNGAVTLDGVNGAVTEPKPVPIFIA